MRKGVANHFIIYLHQFTYTKKNSTIIINLRKYS